jgi:hypothetical protein
MNCRKDPEGSSGVSVLSALDGVGGQRHASSAFSSGKRPIFIMQELGWAPGPIWIGAENLTPAGIPSPDCPLMIII